MPFPLRLACALIPLTLLAACGGDPSPAPEPAPAVPAAPAPSSTTLATSVSQIALAKSGQARVITLTNTGSAPALNLSATPTALPAGTVFSANTCTASLPAGASCSITITPGATPSAAIADPAPTAALLDLHGDNTNTVVVSVSVIDFGSVHQGGYVFDIDDSTAATGSVGGKVVGMSNQPSSQTWGAGIAVSGINETSAAGLGDCDGATDGACNTARIVAELGGSNYAAHSCSTSSASGHTDWYLPAVCELGYNGTGGVCGDKSAPTLVNNIQTRLMDTGHVSSLGGDFYWSSTQPVANPSGDAYWHYFDSVIGVNFAESKANTLRVRCARALTP